jgi:hypothetical protein
MLAHSLTISLTHARTHTHTLSGSLALSLSSLLSVLFSLFSSLELSLQLFNSSTLSLVDAQANTATTCCSGTVVVRQDEHEHLLGEKAEAHVCEPPEQELPEEKDHN